jgi:hypothetical protein
LSETTANTKGNSFDFDREIDRAVARIKTGILALVFGLVCGVGLFAMTAILLIENGPNTGATLQLLGNYFIGYTVTWPGAFIGFGWGFVTGSFVGWSIGMIYNCLVDIRKRKRGTER